MRKTKQNAREAVKNNPKEKGRTLVALVITIIVLLILAVVSMQLIISNGILSKAETGVQKYSEEETKEKIQLAQSEYRMGKLDNESYILEQALENAGITNVTVTGNDEEGYVIALENGNKYEVT